MGDPKKTRKKYNTPIHPWQKARIEDEAKLTEKYALKNKKEIWKMTSMLKSYKDQAKKLGSLNTKQAEKEKDLLMKKLVSYGLLGPENVLTDILTLQTEDIMERRLQSIVMKKGYARTMKQARQFITHGHVSIGGNVVTSPSFMVTTGAEDSVGFKTTSQLNDDMHPERIAKPMAAPKKEKKDTKEKAAKKEEKKTTKKEEKKSEKKDTKKTEENKEKSKKPAEKESDDKKDDKKESKEKGE